MYSCILTMEHCCKVIILAIVPANNTQHVAWRRTGAVVEGRNLCKSNSYCTAPRARQSRQDSRRRAISVSKEIRFTSLHLRKRLGVFGKFDVGLLHQLAKVCAHAQRTAHDKT